MDAIRERPAIINLALAALMLLLVVLSCVGYYPTESGSYSIMGYIGMPSDYPELEEFFEENVEDFNVNDVVGAPLWVACIGVLAGAACVVWRDRAVASLAGLVWSVGGIVGYLTSAYLPLGNAYYLHMLLLALGAVLSAANLMGLKRAPAAAG